MMAHVNRFRHDVAPRSRRVLVMAALAGAVVVLAGLPACQTIPEEMPPEEIVPVITEFTPLSAVTPLEKAEGQYPNLFSADSYAVWVTPEVTALKRQEAAKQGPVEPWLDTNARVVPSEYIVMECHLSSSLGDESVAYNAVSFKGFDVYLEVPGENGFQHVAPAQTIQYPIQEGRQGALRTFSRTNVLVFPRQDLLQGSDTIPLEAPAVKLVLEGVQSRFAFTWPNAAGQPPQTPAEAALQAAKLGYRELYGRLSTLAHMFD